MDDELKQILREIRDIQREHVEILRASHENATKVNEKVLENQDVWRAQNKNTTKLTIIVFVIIFFGLIAFLVLREMASRAAG